MSAQKRGTIPIYVPSGFNNEAVLGVLATTNWTIKAGRLQNSPNIYWKSSFLELFFWVFQNITVDHFFS